MYLYNAIIDYHNEPIKPRVGGYTHWIHSIEGDFTFWAQSALKSDLLTDILSFHYLYVYLFTIWFLPIYFILVKDHVMADKASWYPEYSFLMCTANGFAHPESALLFHTMFSVFVAMAVCGVVYVLRSEILAHVKGIDGGDKAPHDKTERDARQQGKAASERIAGIGGGGDVAQLRCDRHRGKRDRKQTRKQQPGVPGNVGGGGRHTPNDTNSTGLSQGRVHPNSSPSWVDTGGAGGRFGSSLWSATSA